MGVLDAIERKAGNMTRLSRRTLMQGLGALAVSPAFSSFPRPAYAQGAARIVVIGGGAGGATLAKYVKVGAPNANVTLVERNATYTSCFYSNLYYGGFRTIESLTHSYDQLREAGLNLIQDVAVDVDTEARVVTLMSGTRIDYDKLVLSPGIDVDLDAIEGYDAEATQVMPHAWRGGDQTRLLKSQIEAMDDGGVVVVAAPNNPFRCPPGPYERICMIAHYLKTNKPRSKIVLLDAKMNFSKQPVFEEAFETHYPGLIEVNLTDQIDSFEVVKVDPKNKTLTVKSGQEFKADVANVIPPQMAGGIAWRAGCVENRWCPVSPDDFTSTKVKNVYVIGDASNAAQMPKSAFSANSQAKYVANQIVAELNGMKPLPSRLRNTCWSLLAGNDSVKIGASYSVGELAGTPGLVAASPFVSEPGEGASVRARNFKESEGWYSAITIDMFAAP